MSVPADRRRGVIEALDRVVSSGTKDDVLGRAVELLHDTFQHYTWVGIYVRRGDDLFLESWKGPEATGRRSIPVGAGLSGIAAQSGRTIAVDDATGEEYYEPAFSSTQSEIAVPIGRGRDVLGTISIESDRVATFGAGEQAFIERVARMLSSRIER
jgi:GAF domain-containing protein